MPIIAYHNSWPYFARRFRLDFADTIEIKPGVPPSPSHLAGIIRSMRTRGVRMVVREPHEPERDVAFVAAQSGGAGGRPGGVGRRAAECRAITSSLFDANVAALVAAAAR